MADVNHAAVEVEKIAADAAKIDVAVVNTASNGANTAADTVHNVADVAYSAAAKTVERLLLAAVPTGEIDPAYLSEAVDFP